MKPPTRCTAVLAAILTASPSMMLSLASDPPPVRAGQPIQDQTQLAAGMDVVAKRQQEVDRLRREIQRWEKRSRVAEDLALQARTKLATARQEGGNEISSLESALKAQEADLATVDAGLHEASRRLEQLFRGAGNGMFSLISSGDVLRLSVPSHSQVNGAYVVREGGYIILPRAGRVQVMGRSVAGAASLVALALGIKEPAPDVSLFIARPAMTSGRSDEVTVYLTGELLQPGELRMPAANATVLTAVAKAGGTTGDGDLSRVRLLRQVSDASIVEEVNIMAVMDGQGRASDIRVMDGDVIAVASFSPTAYLTGNVATPGSVRLRPGDGLGAYAAIMRSGGFGENGRADSGYVLRDRGNGVNIKIPFRIKDVSDAKAPDILLQGSDIVVVP